MYRTINYFIKQKVDQGVKKVAQKIDEAGEYVAKNYDSPNVGKIIREIGRPAVAASGETLKTIGEAALGTVEAIHGIVKKDGRKVDDGAEMVFSAAKKTVTGLGKGLLMMTATIGEAAYGGVTAIAGAIDGDEEMKQKGLKMLKEKGGAVCKLAAVSTIALGTLEVLDAGVVKAIETPEVNFDQPMPEEPVGIVTPHVEPVVSEDGYFDLAENGDLLPPEDIDELPYIHNGVADPDATDELVELGKHDKAHHIENPDRSEAAKMEFLREHGYDEVPEGYEVHHIVPLYAGGADTPDNMVLVTEEQHDAIHAELDRYYDEKFAESNN